jgi:hypothetical protein
MGRERPALVCETHRRAIPPHAAAFSATLAVPERSHETTATIVPVVHLRPDSYPTSKRVVVRYRDPTATRHPTTGGEAKTIFSSSMLLDS